MKLPALETRSYDSERQAKSKFSSWNQKVKKLSSRLEFPSDKVKMTWTLGETDPRSLKVEIWQKSQKFEISKRENWFRLKFVKNWRKFRNQFARIMNEKSDLNDFNSLIHMLTEFLFTFAGTNRCRSRRWTTVQTREIESGCGCGQKFQHGLTKFPGDSAEIRAGQKSGNG